MHLHLAYENVVRFIMFEFETECYESCGVTTLNWEKKKKKNLGNTEWQAALGHLISDSFMC